MSECYLQHEDDSAICRCDDCGKLTPFGEIEMIRDIEERISPGYICPAGECPHCGALAYLESPHTDSPQAREKGARNAERYNAALNELEIAPNGDDYNVIMGLLNGAEYEAPKQSGR